jgi:hypothetical protein
LQCETGSLSGGDHRWFKRSAGKKRPVTRDNNNNNNNNIIIIIIIIIIISVSSPVSLGRGSKRQYKSKQ